MILVTNDDGIYSPGIVSLSRALDRIDEVFVIAPDRERSAVGHALTLHRPLRVEQIGRNQFCINGTPSDCVNLGVLGILSKKPDLVVSGINRGANLGDDVTYSGTVSAAMEGTLLGIFSIAISLVKEDFSNFKFAAKFGAKIAKIVLNKGLPRDTLLNINIPAKKGKEIKGVKITKLGRRIYSEKIVEKIDPRGKKYYWIGPESPQWHQDENTDFEAIAKDMISITPLHLDLTNYKALPKLCEWELDINV